MEFGVIMKEAILLDFIRLNKMMFSLILSGIIPVILKSFRNPHLEY